ncbi:MAG: aminotransferase class V-fold PLP-dependent enzyme [Desulfobacterales bacterium]
MHANNETGSIQPVAEIGALAAKNNIIMHTDAAQSVGKIPVDVKALNVSLLSVAGHKVYAPKGIGVLYMKKPLTWNRFATARARRRAGVRVPRMCWKSLG